MDKITATLDGRFLRIRAQGPLSIDDVLQYHNKVQPLRDQLRGAPWVSVLQLDQVEQLPEQSIPLLLEGIKDAVSGGLVASAILLSNVRFSADVTAFWADIHQQCGLSYRFFETLPAAEGWLWANLRKAQRLPPE
ncbi:hypothetical protein LJ739_10080 [Aestuariibacter halophilus]|uniref:STAS/SEC14 domain-containing protein n=1 Tax=Fluctibacter halophilus TaxID=226011 RepID=A0ABS8G7M0_9ALTE|nr:hypothetical protein [Aestuariibacter halophilus]MCC2616589.1 hypothetical protein [Aestuariibacter halophilus]